MIEVSVQLVTLVLTFPRSTFPMAVPKSKPLICTEEPRLPEEGERPAAWGGFVTVKLTVLLLVQLSVTTVTAAAPKGTVSGTAHSISVSDQERIGSQATLPILAKPVPWAAPTCKPFMVIGVARTQS